MNLKQLANVGLIKLTIFTLIFVYLEVIEYFTPFDGISVAVFFGTWVCVLVFLIAPAYRFALRNGFVPIRAFKGPHQ